MKSTLFFFATLLALFPLAVLSGTSIDTRDVRRRAPIIDPRTRPPPTLARRAPPKANKPKAPATAAKQKTLKGTTAAKKTQKGTTATTKKVSKGTTPAKGKSGATCALTPGAKGRIGKRADCNSAGGGADSGTGTWSLLCAKKAGGSSSTAGKKLGKRAPFKTLSNENFFTCGGNTIKYNGQDIKIVAPEVLKLWREKQAQQNKPKIITSTAEYPRFNHNTKVTGKQAGAKNNQLVPNEELTAVGLKEQDRGKMWDLVEYPVIRGSTLWKAELGGKDRGKDRMLLAIPRRTDEITGVWVATHQDAAEGIQTFGEEKAGNAHKLVPFGKEPEKAKGPAVVLGAGAGTGADAKRDPARAWGAATAGAAKEVKPAGDAKDTKAGTAGAAGAAAAKNP